MSTPAPAHDGSSGRTPGFAAPSDVQTAFKLLMASIAVSVVASVCSLIAAPEVLDATLSQTQLPPGMTAEDLRGASQVFVFIGVGFSVVILALYLLFSLQMRKGKNWARITLTVLVVIGVIFLVLGFGSLGVQFSASTVSAIGTVGNMLATLLSIAAVFFMFRPSANEYFRQVSEQADFDM